MATDEIEESQSGVEEGGMGGPGAPTPLSALEVRDLECDKRALSNLNIGCGRTYEERYSIDHRRRL